VLHTVVHPGKLSSRKQLVDKQLIFVEPTKVITKDGGVRNGNLLYTIRPLEYALEHHLHKQMASGC